jgi:WD40 repeat protein
MLYDGFISYSHAADGKLAPALQRALHTLAKPWYRPRALRVFRDKTSLSANPALWPAIEQALAESEWFLFMASPQAAQSVWVRKELEWWVANRASNRILILLTDGELSWDERVRDFDWQRTTSVPTTLRGCFSDEPLYVDLRRAKAEESLSIRHLQFRSAVLTVAAPLHGKAMDELDGEDVRQLRRNKAWAWSAASALFVLFVMAIGAAVFAIGQRNEAVQQRDVAQGRQLRAEAQRLEAVESQWTLAVLLAIEASRRADDANSYEQLWKLIAMGAKPVGRFIAKEMTGSRLAFSPDGQLVATGGDGAVIVFQARGGAEVKRISFPGSPRFIGFSATGDQIVAAGGDSVRIFDLASSNEIARRDDGSPKGVFSFSEDGQFAAVMSGMRVKVMEVFTGRVLAASDLPAPVQKVVVSPGGKRLALISQKKAWLLDTASGQSTALPDRRADISAMAFSADATWVAIASQGENDAKEDVVVVDAATAEERDRLSPGSHVAWFSPAGKLLITAPSYRSLLVRDEEAGSDSGRIALLDSAEVVHWSRGVELVVVGTGEQDSTTNVFRVGTWRRLARLKHQGDVRVEAVATSPNADLVASRANRITTIFEADHGVALARFRKTGGATRVAVGAGGKTIAGVLDRNTVLAFAAGSDRPLARLEHCNGRALSLSADGARLAAGCQDGLARIIDIRADKLIGKVPHGANNAYMAISPDGRMVFAIGPRGATVFDAEGREVRVIGGDSVSAVAFDPAAKQVAVAGIRGASVFDTSGDQGPKRFDDHQLIESVAFSPNGKRVALGARNRFVSVYDIDASRRVAALDHKEEEKEVLRVSSMAFSADGRMLASVARDPTVAPGEGGATLRVFNIDDGKQLIRVPLPETPHYVGFSADQAFLEVAVGDEDIRLERFPTHAQGLIENACARVGRNLSEEEWARYLGDAPPRKTCIKLNPAAAEVQ